MSRLRSDADGSAIDLAAEILRQGRPMDVRVYGESMWPLVRQGDRVRIDPNQTPVRGRLAAALLDGHLVVHRVVSLSDSHCVLLGDFGGRRLSLPITEILGVVTHQWTRGGRAISHSNTLLAGVGWLTSMVTPRTRLPWRMARKAHRRLVSVCPSR